MASLVGPPHGHGHIVLGSENENGYKVWEDQSFIKWRKRDPHVTLRCHDSVEGTVIQVLILMIIIFSVMEI